jgi:3-oxoacyl-[acyl-carrier protein] reductase
MFKKLIYTIITVFLCLKPLESKTICITGASGDIGITLVKHFVNQGHQVICHYFQNLENLKALEKQFPKKIFLIYGDFNQPNTMQALWMNVLKISPHIDVVINSAGMEQEDTSLDQIQRIMNINYLSPRLICDYAMEHFQKQKIAGIIVNLGSRAAYRGLPKGYYTYADSKVALTKYSYDLARDNAKHSSVYVVAPGPVEGKMFQGLNDEVKAQCLASMPTGRPVKVQEVVEIVDLLVSGKVPSATGSVFDLMGASWAH